MLAVFAGIHQTLGVEAELRSRGISVSLIPTPPSIERGCSFSVLVPGQEAESGNGRGWWDGLSMPGVLYEIVVGEKGKRYEEVDRREGPGVPATGHHVPQGARRGPAR